LSISSLCKISNLRGINTHVRFNSHRLHHFNYLIFNKIEAGRKNCTQFVHSAFADLTEISTGLTFMPLRGVLFGQPPERMHER